MHDTAYRIGGLILDTYLPSTQAKILEVGAQNVNGTLRDHAPRNADYIGLDFEEGEGVDIIVTGLSDWDVPDASFDLVMASSVFEHDKAFWQTFLVMCAKTKPGGHIYLSAPANGTIHRYPRDYWRFYPDAGLALEEWARAEGFDVTLVESFVAERDADVWNDFCAVFRCGGDDAGLNCDFVYQKVPCTNALSWRSSVIVNPTDDSEDTRLLRVAHEEQQRWVAHSDHLIALHSEELELRTRQIAKLTQEVEHQAGRLKSLDETTSAKDDELEALRSRAAELTNRLNRLGAETEQQARQREEQIRQIAASNSELQSRLAQREEEAAQAWRCAEEREKERDQLAADAEKAKADLADANGWVENLALTRTLMERQVNRLEKELAKLGREFERVQQRNCALIEQIDVLSAQPSVVPERSALTDGHALLTRTEVHESVKRPHEELEKAYVSTKAELETSYVRIGEFTQDLSETRLRLDESHDEIASLSDMIAAAQDQIEELERQNKWLRQAGCFMLERGKWWWRLMPAPWQRRKRDANLLRRNLFDAESYTSRYPDVASSGQDPFRHFIHHGIVENRRYD